MIPLWNHMQISYSIVFVFHLSFEVTEPFNLLLYDFIIKLSNYTSHFITSKLPNTIYCMYLFILSMNVLISKAPLPAIFTSICYDMSLPILDFFFSISLTFMRCLISKKIPYLDFVIFPSFGKFPSYVTQLCWKGNFPLYV